VTRPLAVLALLATPLVARAQADDDPCNCDSETVSRRLDQMPVKASALVYASYGLDLTQGAGAASAFSLDRAYLTLWADLGKQWGARVTLDVGRASGPIVALPDGTTLDAKGDTKLRAFLKYAFFEWRPAGTGLKLRAGSVGTPLVPWEDGIYGDRYITRQFAESSVGHHSADIGVSLSGKEAKGLIRFEVGVFNGEGYGAAENDTGFGKAVQGRLAIDPFGPTARMSLPIYVFAMEDVASRGEDSIFTWAGGAIFKGKYLTAGAEYDGKYTGEVKGSGFTTTVEPRLPKVGGLLVRFDYFDPHAKATGDATSHLIAGVSRDLFSQQILDPRFTRKISAALTYERTSTQGTPASGADPGVFVHVQAGI